MLLRVRARRPSFTEGRQARRQISSTLLAFGRHLGNADAQVFAMIVMVVAACEVVVGLGLIVAMYRRRIPLDVDENRGLRG